MTTKGQTVVVNPDHLEGGDGSVRMAMHLWSGENDAVLYNDWQSVYWQLRRMGYTDPEQTQQESQQAFHDRLKEWYKDIQSSVHGDGFKMLAVQSAQRKQEKSALGGRPLGSGAQLRLQGGPVPKRQAAVPRALASVREEPVSGRITPILRVPVPKKAMIPLVGGEAARMGWRRVRGGFQHQCLCLTIKKYLIS